MSIRRRRERGQSLVEFCVVLPVVLIMFMGMLEIGFAINHNTSIESATRQGARVASTMVGCGRGTRIACAEVDKQIIAAVEGALKTTGSPVIMPSKPGDPCPVDSITIFLADAGGAPIKSNVWTCNYHAGPTVGGVTLDFVPGTTGWDPYTRGCITPAQSIGVRIDYTYTPVTPLGAVLATADLGGFGPIHMRDQTVYALEPVTANLCS